MNVNGEVSLTGSKVNQQDKRVLANAVAITDINTKFYDGASWIGSLIAIPNWNNYNRHIITVISSLDQTVDLTLVIQMRGNGVNFDTLSATAAKTLQKVTIPANGPFAPILLTKSDMVGLDGVLPYNVSITLKCAVAPTTGSISVTLEQWAE